MSGQRGGSLLRVAVRRAKRGAEKGGAPGEGMLSRLSHALSLQTTRGNHGVGAGRGGAERWTQG